MGRSESNDLDTWSLRWGFATGPLISGRIRQLAVISELTEVKQRREDFVSLFINDRRWRSDKSSEWVREPKHAVKM